MESACVRAGLLAAKVQASFRIWSFFCLASGLYLLQVLYYVWFALGACWRYQWRLMKGSERTMILEDPCILSLIMYGPRRKYAHMQHFLLVIDHVVLRLCDVVMVTASLISFPACPVALHYHSRLMAVASLSAANEGLFR